MIDTHCHINMKDYDQDIDQVILEAKQAGVEKLLVIGMDTYHNQRAIELAEKYSGLYATVGLHPVDVNEGTLEGIEPLFSHPKVVAVGECGLDFYHTTDNKDLQIEMFIKQIELSIEYDLPLVVHTRNSFTETYNCLLPYKGKVRGVFHCFSSDLADAKKAIDLGFYVGIDGPVTFKNAPEIKEIAKEIPLDKLLIETDSPFLSPHPFRGKRNEPKRVKLVLEAIAELRGSEVMEIEKQTTKNATKLFQLGDDEQ